MFFSPCIGIVGSYHTWSPSFDITYAHLQALWCIYEHAVTIQVLSPASVSGEAAAGNTRKATRFITQSKPSTLPTARAIRLLHRLTHSFAGSFLLVFVCNHTTCKGGDWLSLTWRLECAGGGQAASCHLLPPLSDSLGQRKYPAQAAPFCVVRWDDSRKPSSTCWWSFPPPCFLSLPWKIHGSFPIRLKVFKHDRDILLEDLSTLHLHKLLLVSLLISFG